MLRPFATVTEGRVATVEARDVLAAAERADAVPLAVGARDLLHAAVMRRLGVTRVVSADRDFAAIPGLTRLDLAAALA